MGKQCLYFDSKYMIKMDMNRPNQAHELKKKILAYETTNRGYDTTLVWVRSYQSAGYETARLGKKGLGCGKYRVRNVLHLVV